MSNKKDNLGVINSTETGQAVISFLKGVSSKEMIDLFVKSGLLDEGDHEFGFSFCVDRLSENATAYILAKMIQEFGPAILESFNVIDGFYKGRSHSWIQVKDAKDIFIDPSLAQFHEDRVPDIAIVDSRVNENYDFDEFDVTPAQVWLEVMSKIKIDTAPTGEDVVAVEKTKPGKVEYIIGGGEYSYDEEISPAELISLVLYEFDLDMQNGSLDLISIKDEADKQDFSTKIDEAMKELEIYMDSATR